MVTARLPASWAVARLPSSVGCQGAYGTVWRGRCAAAAFHGQPLGVVNWTLHPLALLMGRLDADVQVAGVALSASGAVGLRRDGAVSARSLSFDMQLPSPLLRQLPADLSGRLRANLSRLHLSHGWIDDIQGHIEVHELFSGGRRPAALGAFELIFSTPALTDGRHVGSLRDLGGPLEVQGRLTLGTTPGYLLEGSVAARPEASDILRDQLTLLGPPDAQGRRRFAQEAEL